MTNQRVVVGVSLAGTTLAALIALYWFWNRKDEKKTAYKGKRLQVSTADSSDKTAGTLSTQCDLLDGSEKHSNEGNSLSSVNELTTVKRSSEVNTAKESVRFVTSLSPLSDFTPDTSPIVAGIGSDLRITSDYTSIKSASCFADTTPKVQATHDTTVRHRTIGQSQSEHLSSSNHSHLTSAPCHDKKIPGDEESHAELSLASSNHVSQVCTRVEEKGIKTVSREDSVTESKLVKDFETTDAGVSRNRNVESESTPASSGEPLCSVVDHIQLQDAPGTAVSYNSSLPLNEQLGDFIQTDIKTEVPSSHLLTAGALSETGPENTVSVLGDTEAIIPLKSDIILNQQQPNLETVNVDDSDIDEGSNSSIESKPNTEVVENLASETQDILSKSSLLHCHAGMADIEYHVETSPETNSSPINSLAISSSNYNKDDLPNVKTVNNDKNLQDFLEKKSSSSVLISENIVKTVQGETGECVVKGNNSDDLQVQEVFFADTSSPSLLATNSSSVSRTDNTEPEITSAESTRDTLEVGDKNAASLENILGEVGLSPSDSHEEILGREPSQSLSRDSLEPPDSLNGCSSGSGESLNTDTVVMESYNSVPDNTSTPIVHQAVNGDNTSEASNDSGKGASVGEAMMLHQPIEMTMCQIDFPSELCGRFIGKSGKNVNYIKERTATSITLRENPYTDAYQLCCIEGYRSDIEEALAMIRERFPKSRYPNLQLEYTEPIQASPVILPDLQMTLPPGVSVDVIVSSVATGGLIFLQQPTHPTFPSLERLNQFMLACYSQDQSTPHLPRPLEAGVICAAPVMGGWYRAMVVELLEDDCDIKFVDYGGYCRIPIDDLRQIRSDFMTLPFQAVECYMGNLTPVQGEMSFGSECASVLGELTEGKLLQAQVVGRATDGIPFVHIYQVSGNKVLFVNREMVNRGVAQWIEQL